MRIVKVAFGTTSRSSTFASQEYQKEKIKSKKLENYLKE